MLLNKLIDLSQSLTTLSQGSNIVQSQFENDELISRNMKVVTNPCSKKPFIYRCLRWLHVERNYIGRYCLHHFIIVTIQYN